MKKLTIALLFVSVLVCSSFQDSEGWGDLFDEQEQMNVLFLVVDDLNTWLLSNPDRYTGKVIAPNILHLAESGVSFSQAFAASPKCSPSRTAILSGVAPWKSGIYDNGLDVDASPALKDVPSLPNTFKQQGYYIASFGKISHGY